MLLERLSNACGVPGREDEVRELIRQELVPYADDIWTDPMGNLIVRKGSGPIRVMLDAHMDEVGFVVGGYTEDGCLQFKQVGGCDPRVLPGRAVWVTNDRMPGVIGAKAFHLCSDEERNQPVPVSEMVIDVGARTREEAEALCELGDPIYFASTFERLGQHVVKGKAFDDRAGCAVVAALMQEASYPGITLYGVFTCQEEVGLRGARIAAYNLNPDVAIAIDATASGNVPGIDPFDTSTNMGEGPAIYLLDAQTVPNARLRSELVRVAKERMIPHQFKRLTAGGTDSVAIQVQRGGIPSCAVSIPSRYIHSGASLMDMRDFAHTCDLIQAFLGSVDKGEFRP